MKSKKLHYAWVVLIGYCLFSFVGQGMVLGTIGAYMTAIAKDMGVGQTQISLIMTFEMLGMAVAMTVVGGVMRKLPLRLLTSVSVALIAGGLLLSSFASSLVMLYVAWALIGVSMSVILLLGVIIGNWFADKLGIAMGISVAAASAGSALFNPTVSALITAVGWRMSYQISAAVLVVILIPVGLFMLRFAPGEGESAYGADKMANTNTQGFGANDGLTLKEASRTSLFYISIFATALFGTFVSLGQQVVPHLVSRGFQPTLAATALSCLSIGSATGKLVIGPFLDGKRRNAWVMLFAIAGMVGWAAIAAAPGMALTFIGGAVCGLGQSVGMVAVPYFSRRFLGGKDMAKISGISGAVCTLFPAVGVVLSASVYDSTGSYSPVFFFASVVSILLTVAVLISYAACMKRRAAMENAACQESSAGA